MDLEIFISCKIIDLKNIKPNKLLKMSVLRHIKFHRWFNEYLFKKCLSYIIKK